LQFIWWWRNLGLLEKKSFSCREYTLDFLLSWAYWIWLWFRVHKNIKQLKDVGYICKIVVGSQVFLLLMDFPCLFHHKHCYFMLSGWSNTYQDLLSGVDNLSVGTKLLIWLHCCALGRIKKKLFAGCKESIKIFGLWVRWCQSVLSVLEKLWCVRCTCDAKKCFAKLVPPLWCCCLQSVAGFNGFRTFPVFK